MRSIPGIILLILAQVAMVCAQEPVSEDGQSIMSAVDWESGTLVVTVTRAVPKDVMNLPAATTRVRNQIEQDSVGILVTELRKLTHDSLRTLNERILEDEALIRDVVAAASSARMTDARATPDLQEVAVAFAVDLHSDLMGALIRHDRPIPLTPLLGWMPTADYTGIVIYAADRLPVHGTDRQAYVQPALFPGIYAMTPSGNGITRVMEVDHVSADHVSRWGPVLYSFDVNDATFTERAGARPLRIIAYKAFGRYPTDVVINTDDALQILASENNRSLIAEGRVVIVLNREQVQ